MNGRLEMQPMNPYHNLPREQHATQRLVDQFNADERLWKALEPNRRARRKTRPKLSRKQAKVLDLLEFAKARPPQDCIGQRIQPWKPDDAGCTSTLRQAKNRPKTAD